MPCTDSSHFILEETYVDPDGLFSLDFPAFLHIFEITPGTSLLLGTSRAASSDLWGDVIHVPPGEVLLSLVVEVEEDSIPNLKVTDALQYYTYHLVARGFELDKSVSMEIGGRQALRQHFHNATMDGVYLLVEYERGRSFGMFGAGRGVGREEDVCALVVQMAASLRIMPKSPAPRADPLEPLYPHPR
jgi:hypothetical protein